MDNCEKLLNNIYNNYNGYYKFRFIATCEQIYFYRKLIIFLV